MYQSNANAYTDRKQPARYCWLPNPADADELWKALWSSPVLSGLSHMERVSRVRRELRALGRHRGVAGQQLVLPPHAIWLLLVQRVH